MTDLNVKPNPKRPYKTYAAVVSAFLVSFLATNATDLPPLVVGALTGIVAAIAVYATPNPLVAVEPPAGQEVENAIVFETGDDLTPTEIADEVARNLEGKRLT